MKILYGVQGTGNGHISRARAMAEAFADHDDIEVQFLFSGRPENAFFDMEIFGDYLYRKGLTFISHAGKVDLVKTVKSNDLWQFIKDVKALDVRHFDLVISDFEPVTAHAAKRQRVPSLSISHQSAFLCDVPKHGQGLVDRFIMCHFAPTEMKVGLHWYHFNQPILPPIIDLKCDKTERSKTILTYLPFERLEDVVDTLRHFSEPFVCFHPDCPSPTQRDNVEIRPLSKSEFHRALLSCAGVIANGGFELPSEALFLGKKLLLKPLSGQFEQQSNVATLDMMGLASTMDTLDKKAISTWLAQRESNRVIFPDVATALADWVAQGDLSTLDQLRDALWSQVTYPEHVTDLMSDFWPSQRRKRALFSMRLSSEVNIKT
ncbi:glycosyltransferase [Enterovibrio sp. ZSDZ35]|uniref:Glycosyltransferase n=1 Tax=Enterovibrio qingdaonensis TaxID=2899818 RepID=A0ABT5QM42_9GAMM|nr:MJ1255/VC2487 family glycosyltransferase [Enterovibrio sp. ZSDZ35]MDD1781649.1 glycosyltransferase [Enterovibrio sp. ZSDZ35]